MAKSMYLGFSRALAGQSGQKADGGVDLVELINECVWICWFVLKRRSFYLSQVDFSLLS